MLYELRILQESCINEGAIKFYPFYNDSHMQRCSLKVKDGICVTCNIALLAGSGDGVEKTILCTIRLSIGTLGTNSYSISIHSDPDFHNQSRIVVYIEHQVGRLARFRDLPSCCRLLRLHCAYGRFYVFAD